MDLPPTDAELGRLEADADDDRVRRLAREVRRLRQALRRYAIHDDDCALEAPHEEEAPPACSCGLDAVAGLLCDDEPVQVDVEAGRT